VIIQERKRGIACGAGFKNFPEVIMDRPVVINNQNAPVSSISAHQLRIHIEDVLNAPLRPS